MNEIIMILSEHGVFILFAVVLAKQIGAPIPAFPLFIAAGTFAASGRMAFDQAFATSVLAALIGDQMWFEFGRRYGRLFLNRLSYRSVRASIRWAEEFFGRHGVSSLMVSKFVPVLSTIAPPVAGMTGLSLSLYLRYNTLGTVLWVGSGLGIGYMFGGEFDRTLLGGIASGPVAGVVSVAGIILYVAYTILYRERAEYIGPVFQRVTGNRIMEEEQGIQNLRPHDRHEEIQHIRGWSHPPSETSISGCHDHRCNGPAPPLDAWPRDTVRVHTAWWRREKELMRTGSLLNGKRFRRDFTGVTTSHHERHRRISLETVTNVARGKICSLGQGFSIEPLGPFV